MLQAAALVLLLLLAPAVLMQLHPGPNPLVLHQTEMSLEAAAMGQMWYQLT
jgi:hypothetical protein